MPGPNWSDDHPDGLARIAGNARRAATDAYLGAFRGDQDAHLADDEVGVGSLQPDGYPDRVGVWANEVQDEVERFFRWLSAAFMHLDALLPDTTRPSTVDELHEVVELCALTHGEWIRIHPFVNGNGRTARLIAGHIALRYGLPMFVQLKPRPHDTAYARAARQSMGRPPDFDGDHSLTTKVFTHLLALHLLP